MFGASYWKDDLRYECTNSITIVAFCVCLTFLPLWPRIQVRVLVRDLYSKTLNTLGTGVAYCQGDLNNMDSLEYALTDVDKIVVCAAAPRPDEEDFKGKFLGFAQDNLNDKILGGIDSPEQHRKRSSEIYDERSEEHTSELQIGRASCRERC